jgi:hypothetical protein
VRDEQRRAEIERQGYAQREKRVFLEVLAERLANECNLPLATARRRVEKLSVTACVEREQATFRNAKFG